MPDRLGFNHESWWGVVYHRCVECEWPGWMLSVSQKDRERHHAMHTREREAQIEKARKSGLAKARKTKSQIERENRQAYGGDASA